MTSNDTAPASLGEFDYIIVGGGTAGCLLANRLSADPTVRVLMLEAGREKQPFWVSVPLGIYKTIGDPRVDWRFRTEPEPGLDNRQIPIPRGSGLGGSSLLYGMVYIRGQAADYDRWRDLGNPGWGWSDVQPLFKRSEDFHAGPNADHGTGGEWRVEDVGSRWEILDKFRDAAATLGIPAIDDVNSGDNHGVAYFNVTQRGGRRVSSRNAFLDPIRSRPNLTVIAEAPAKRVLLDGKRASGVEFWRAGVPTRATAKREVLVTCGAIGSPQLLQASGIGPADLLAQHGIPVLHALPGVGENLQDHIQTRMTLNVSNVKTMNARAGTALGKLGIGIEYFLLRRGPLAAPATKMCGFVRSDPSYATPNVQFHVIPMSTPKFGDPVHPFPGVTVSICNLRPSSTGSVRLRSADTRVAPAIQGRFLTTEEDQRVAIDSMRLTRRIWQAAPVARYAPQEIEPGVELQSDEALLAHARRTAMTVFHPVGTCRMGPDEMAVVDARLKVHGLQGLRVVDASIMPTIPSGNTASPVVMVAEKAADMILADQRA
jgi:choline dehydrogenase